MGLFGSRKPKTYLGVDLGGSSIKVVEIGLEKGRAKLMTYGYSESAPGAVPVSPFDDPKAAGKLLAKICKNADVRTTSVLASLPTSAVFNTILSLPKQRDKKALQPMIDAEVGKLAPLPLKDMVTYNVFLDDKSHKPDPAQKKEMKKKKKEQKENKEEQTSTDAAEDHTRVLVTGAARTLVNKYIEIFKTAKLNLQAIDTEAFALIRSLIGKDKSAIAILDIGAKRSSLTIVEKGIPFVSRSINLGGLTLTKRLMDQMKIDEDQAERMKRDLAAYKGGASDLAGGLPPILEAMMQPIVNEIRYAFQLYANMELTQGKVVEKLILTGGSSHLPKIKEYLSETLKMNVYRGNPWARVAHPIELRDVLDEVGPSMSVAIGLGMREID